MKNSFLLSILLGSLILLGCQDETANIKSPTEETKNSEPSVKIPNGNDTIMKENTSPVLLNLTQVQKEEYYEEYVAILEKVNEVFTDSPDLELEPITKFHDNYWLEIEDFEKLAKERKNMTILIPENKERYNPESVPKTVKFLIDSKETMIKFNGSFDTQLNENTSKGRQLFSAFHSISSKAADGDGSWNQLVYNEFLTDSGATYAISVGGQLSQFGLISTHTMTLKFNCDEYGGIS